MDAFEQKLKRALKHEEPPPGFAERVLARALAAKAEPRPWPPWAWLFQPAWRVAMAGVLALALVIGGVIAYERRQERLRAERATAELMLALEITHSKLIKVRNVLVERHSNENRN